jgi:hypothetical protein
MFFDPAIVVTLKLKEKTSERQNDTPTREPRFTLFANEQRMKRSRRQHSYSLELK